MADFVIKNPRCPKCGTLAYGTLEDLTGTTELEIDEKTGEARHSGYTQVDWEGQSSRCDDDGKRLLICPDGHVWPMEEVEDNGEET